MWRTFNGEDISRRNLINEVIKVEQASLKDEPMDEEELAEFLKAQKRAKKAKTKVKVEVKEEPASPSRRLASPAGSPRRRHDSSSDEEPRRRRHDSDSDGSPPRRRADSGGGNAGFFQHSLSPDSDASPARRPKAEADSDASPPRRPKAEEDSDASPPRRGGGGSDSDLSPPREGQGMGKGMKMTLDGESHFHILC